MARDQDRVEVKSVMNQVKMLQMCPGKVLNRKKVAGAIKSLVDARVLHGALIVLVLLHGTKSNDDGRRKNLRLEL